MTTITLDRRALHALIDSDPDFALQLKKAVISEVAKRFFEKDCRRIFAEAEPELFKRSLAAMQEDVDGASLVQRALRETIEVRPHNWGANVRLTDDMKKLLAEEVERLKFIAIDQAKRGIYDEIAEKVRVTLDNLNIDDRVERRVARLTDEYVNARVKTLFERRLRELSQT